MAKVFIAYSRVDSDFANVIHAALTTSGHDVWIDVAGITGGQNWKREIEEAIRNSDWLIILISPDSNDSGWVREETAFALQINKRILPVLVRASKVPLLLSHIQYIDVTQNPSQALIEINRVVNQSTIPSIPDMHPPTQEDIRRVQQETEVQKSDRVFIAYSRKQHSLAKDLAELLYKHKKPNFYDAHIRAGARWRQIIQKALDDATHLVVIWTTDAAKSDEVEREVSYALAEGKYIIPLLSNEIPKLPYHLHGLQYIVLEQDLNTIENELLHAINLYKADDDVYQ